ncbi:MAG: hypothetical protein D6696_14330 [Acidobacteria bacterium]|nr:MAG: hypothetical protein D6696_14330 [Acidobacteriota bacterium]
MKKPAYAVYGVVSYLVSLGSFFYFAGWVSNNFVPKTVDSGTPPGTLQAFAWNTVLLTVYCFLHSIFARTSLKEKMRRYVPRTLERATYCLAFSILLVVFCLLWQPIPEPLIWQVTSQPAVAAIYGLFVLFWAAHFLAIYMIGYNEFFGLRQAWQGARGEDYRPPPPVSERYYMAGHLLLVASLMAIPWATPTMSLGQLYFCVYVSVYIVIGAWLSSRDLGDMHAPLPEPAKAAGDAMEPAA